MPSLFNPEELVNFGKNLTKDTLNTLPLWAREKPPVASPSISAPVNASKEALAGIEDIDRTGDLAAGLLKGSRGALNTLGSLPYLNVEKGQDLLDSIGTAEKSFYQGKIPNEALAKFASPSVGAATGAAAGAAISHFTPHPLAKVGLPTIGGAIGGALGLLGSGNLTPDQKKAAQIRSEEAGAQKPFVNALQKGDWRQLQADAISALGAYPKLASDVAATIVGIPNAISENIGKGLKETNIPLLKQYGEITEEGAKKAQKSSEESHKFLEDLINKTTNLPYQVKDEKEGRAVAMQLPLEALRSLSSEEMKALVRGENPNNISIPAALSKAYSESQNLNAQKRMVQEFKKQGKSDEEIEKLVSFGMAGRPLESMAQGFATDPTMYIDPLIGLSKLGKVGKGAQRIKAEQKLLTQGEKGGELATIGKQELATKPIEGELIEPVAAPRPTGQIIEGTSIETPKQIEGKTPLQLEAPKSLDSELLSERQRLETEGIDPTDPEGETQLINSLVSKGYDEDEIIQTILKQEEAGIEPPATTPESSNIPKQEILQPQTPEQHLPDSYVNPSEQDIYSLLKEGTLPLEEDLTYKLTHGGGLPLGFYETTPKGEKLVPIYQDVEKGIAKRVPVKFQFSSPLEKEIFNLGGEYVDWMRDAAIGDIKAEQGIERTSTAHKVLTDKQRQERFKDMGRRLLTGTSDPTYIDNLGLPNEGKKELEALEEQFVKKIYSGGKASKGGTEGEGVVGHVPNSIRKELLKQIETKFGFTGKTAAEKKAILQKIKPEDLADVVFSPQSTAYKGIIDKTKEFRSMFSDLLTKYGIKPPSSLKEEIPMSQSKEAILQQGKGTTEGMTQGEGTLLRNLNKGKSQIEQGTPLLESIANQKEKGIKGLLESPQTLKESEGIKEIPMSEIPKSNLGKGTPIEPELVKSQGNIPNVNTPSNDIIKEESINAVEKVKELKKKNGEMLTKYGEKWKTDPTYKQVQNKIKELETIAKKEPYKGVKDITTESSAGQAPNIKDPKYQNPDGSINLARYDADEEAWWSNQKGQPTSVLISKEEKELIQKKQALEKKKGALEKQIAQKNKSMKLTPPSIRIEATRKLNNKLADLDNEIEEINSTLTKQKNLSTAEQPKPNIPEPIKQTEKPKSPSIVGSKLEFNGKEYNISGVQEESGLPIIDMPNKDGSITKLPLTKNSISKTNWNSLKKNLTKGSQFQESSSGISILAGQAIPSVEYNPLKFNDKLLLSPKQKYEAGTTLLSDLPEMNQPRMKEMALTHEKTHGIQGLAGEIPTREHLVDLIKNPKNKELAELATKQIDDYFEGYMHTVLYGTDTKQQNQFLKLYNNAEKLYPSEKIPTELGANIAVLKKLEPDLKGLGINIYKDPELNKAIKNQPMLKDMVDAYLARKDSKPLGEGSHWLDNIAQYENELKSVAKYNIQGGTQQTPIAKFEGFKLGKLPKTEKGTYQALKSNSINPTSIDTQLEQIQNQIKAQKEKAIKSGYTLTESDFDAIDELRQLQEKLENEGVEGVSVLEEVEIAREIADLQNEIQGANKAQLTPFSIKGDAAELQAGDSIISRTLTMPSQNPNSPKLPLFEGISLRENLPTVGDKIGIGSGLKKIAETNKKKGIDIKTMYPNTKYKSWDDYLRGVEKLEKEEKKYLGKGNAENSVLNAFDYLKQQGYSTFTTTNLLPDGYRFWERMINKGYVTKIDENTNKFKINFDKLPKRENKAQYLDNKKSKSYLKNAKEESISPKTELNQKTKKSAETTSLPPINPPSSLSPTQQLQYMIEQRRLRSQIK